MYQSRSAPDAQRFPDEWGGLDLLPWVAPRRGGVRIEEHSYSSEWGAPCVETTIAPAPRFVRRAPDVLRAFLRLAEDSASNARVAAFVRRFGPLHLHAGTGMPQGRLTGERTLQERLSEPVGAYRFFARVAKAIVHAGASRDAPTLPRHRMPADTPGLEHGESFAQRPDFAAVYELRAWRLKAGHGGERPRDFQFLSWAHFVPGDARPVASAALTWWFGAGLVFPALEWGDWEHQREAIHLPAGLTAGLTGGLWGAIGIAMLNGILGYSARALCDFCGRALPGARERRPKRGQSACCGRRECKRARRRASYHRHHSR